MTDTRTGAGPETSVSRRRSVDRAFDLYRSLVWAYGGFLIGILSYSWWAGDQLVFWPWSAVFLGLLIGLVAWQRRRSATTSADASTGHRADTFST